MAIREDLTKALKELREESKERKFKQTVDLIINLQKFNVKKDAVNTFVTVPNKIKEKKVCGFLEVKNKKVDTILKDEFKKYKDKTKLKKLVKQYNFFIAQASVMPLVASTFGRVLGPAGKMPSPQLGILVNVDDKTIDELLEKINKSVRIRTKEASVKIAIGKEDLSDEKIVENIMAVFKTLEKALPRERENIKNIEVKFTMTKPKKIKLR